MKNNFLYSEPNAGENTKGLGNNMPTQANSCPRLACTEYVIFNYFLCALKIIFFVRKMMK